MAVAGGVPAQACSQEKVQAASCSQQRDERDEPLGESDGLGTSSSGHPSKLQQCQSSKNVSLPTHARACTAPLHELAMHGSCVPSSDHQSPTTTHSHRRSGRLPAYTTIGSGVNGLSATTNRRCSWPGEPGEVQACVGWGGYRCFGR